MFILSPLRDFFSPNVCQFFLSHFYEELKKKKLLSFKTQHFVMAGLIFLDAFNPRRHEVVLRCTLTQGVREHWDVSHLHLFVEVQGVKQLSTSIVMFSNVKKKKKMLVQ